MKNGPAAVYGVVIIRDQEDDATAATGPVCLSVCEHELIPDGFWADLDESLGVESLPYKFKNSFIFFGVD